MGKKRNKSQEEEDHSCCEKEWSSCIGRIQKEEGPFLLARSEWPLVMEDKSDVRWIILHFNYQQFFSILSQSFFQIIYFIFFRNFIIK